MYLIDTNVLSEIRKAERANPGVRDFFRRVISDDADLYLSVVTVGELRRGLELIRHRGDVAQAELLERWLREVLEEFAARILPVDSDIAQVWGRLRAPHAQHPLDKLIAATGLIHDLTVVTQNEADFMGCGVRLLNPFSPGMKA